MLPSDKERLQHIAIEIDRILSTMNGKTVEDLNSDYKISHIISNAMNIMGEASKHIILEFRKACPEIPWKDMINLRNRLTHNYDGIDFSVVYEVIKNDLPGLKVQVGKVLHPVGAKQSLLPKKDVRESLLPKKQKRFGKGRGI